MRLNKQWQAYLAGAGLTAGWLAWGNLTVGTTRYSLKDPKLPRGFEGMRILQISDFHNKRFPGGNAALVQAVKAAKPELIFLTGDLVNSRDPRLDTIRAFLAQIAEVAPCYYVTGNHEGRLEELYPRLEQEIQALGITVLHNEGMVLKRGGDTLWLMGVDDPLFNLPVPEKRRKVFFPGRLKKAARGGEGRYKILLSHRPERFDLYRKQGINLVFAGHAHGGQVRLPFLGGVLAPSQGFFPPYDGGVYRDGITAMVVSRGVGDSVIPLRVNNRPQLVLAVLHSTKD